jgi:hypothetical protein
MEYHTVIEEACDYFNKKIRGNGLNGQVLY